MTVNETFQMNCLAVSKNVFYLLSVVIFFADSCPKPPQNLLCFVGLKNTCNKNTTCIVGTLCCSDGCRQRCRDPSENNRGATEG